ADPPARPALADADRDPHRRAALAGGQRRRPRLRRLLRDLHGPERPTGYRRPGGAADGPARDGAAGASRRAGAALRRRGGGAAPVRPPGRAGPAGAGVTASERLRAKLELVSGALDAAAVPVWQGPDAAQLYPHYLAALHGVARGAVPLMEAALARCRA